METAVKPVQNGRGRKRRWPCGLPITTCAVFTVR